MRRKPIPRRTAMAASTAAMAVALTGALSAPVVAQETPLGDGDTAVNEAGAQRIALITGDTVVVDGRGEVTGLIRGEGREHIPVQVYEGEDSTYVIPSDAQPLIADGT